MPVRKKQNVVVRDYTYEELIGALRFYIDKKYGGLASFMRHPDFEQLGFVEDDKTRMFTYLVIPKKKDGRRIRSVPMVQRLYQSLLGINIVSEIVIRREQVIRSKSNKLQLLLDEVPDKSYT